MSEQPRALNERLTVVLFTHNRPALLHRALQYYQGLPCTVRVLDSSSQSNAEVAAQYANVDYHYLPQFSYTGLLSKLKHGITLVDTPHMVFAADDDFPLHSALVASLEFLEANPDYGMCHGYCLMYHAHANQVGYYRRDRKVQEDYDHPAGEQRAVDYMGQYLPPFYAVTRTTLLQQWMALIPDDISFEWMEISHVYWLLANAKARVLPMPYVVRELNYPYSEHDTDVLRVLGRPDQASANAREGFAEFLAGLPTAITGLDAQQRKDAALASFAAMAECLSQRTSLDMTLIFESRWTDAFKPPARFFHPVQFVEMPFYNQAFFDQLAVLEFLIHGMPAGRLQLQQLEGIWTRQEILLEVHPNDTTQTMVNRLWQAMDCNVFNRRVVRRLAECTALLGEHEASNSLYAWSARLDALAAFDNRTLLSKMPSGRLMHWLQARSPEREQRASVQQHLLEQGGGPQFGILLLDLDNDMDKLQITLDSLLEGVYQAFKIVVFTTGEPPVATTQQNTLHFVKVGKSLYIDKLNQVARQSTCDWLMLAEVGDQFTTAGLARAALELQAAPQVRAVAADEIQRQADGALTSAFRPGFNLDLLLSVPALTARHWLLRRDVLLEAGGYSPNFSDALEFDLLLRVIEKGGMSWLAHLDEPLLISRAAQLGENAHERQTLIRHLTTRGYQALVNSEQPGTYRIEYRHSGRPLVSVLLPCQDNLAQLQATLEHLRLRTRYTNYEVLVIDNASQDPAMDQWLDQAEQGRVRVLRSEQPVNIPALYNAASRQAKGEFLVLLDSDAEVVNPNWIESLLNHAQRPEVGVVGTKLIDAAGKVTQAGLLLGFDGGVGAAFAGESKDATGYLHRLAVDQNYSAVSGACLMIGSALYQGVGGLDDDLFGESLSDVDLCLKVGQAGYLTVWTPYVQVLHPGEVVQTPQALAALRGKWAGVFAHDLAYNRNLAQRGTSFTLGEEAPINWAPLLG